MNSLTKVKRGEKWFLFFCIAPALIAYVIFMIYPTFEVFKTSLYHWSGYSDKMDFIGFENFTVLLQDSKFWQSFGNTIFLMFVTTVVTMSLALLFAAVISRSKIRESNFYRIVLFFPNVLSIVIIGILFKNIFDPRAGIINSLLTQLGVDNPPIWLGDKSTVLWAIAIAMIWQAVGYYMVMYIAGMDGVSPELYEVADLEGANQIEQFFKITMPMIWSVMRVTIVFFIISTINMSFQFVTVMTDGQPNGASEVLLSYMNRQAFGNANFGYAMAVAVIIFIFSFTLSIISNKLTAKEE